MARSKDENKRSAILLSARSLFARNGYHATSISDIRRETGLSTGTIYTYFSGKEEIIRCIVEEGWAVISEHIEGSLDKALDVEERISVITEALLPTLLMDDDLIDILLSEAFELTSFEEKLDQIVGFIVGQRPDPHAFRDPVLRQLRTAIVVYFLGFLHATRLAARRNTGLRAQDLKDFAQFLMKQLILSATTPTP